jgi:NAD(P)H-hydrate epimerase
LRAGLGLLTVHVPEAAEAVLQIALPEAMSSIDSCHDCITELPALEKYAAIAAGPGIGKDSRTRDVVFQLIEQAKVPMVLDADALNLLAENPAWIKKLPANTILTPHPAEFDRLSGIVVKTEEQRFQIAEQFVGSYGVILVLKGAYSRIFFPDGTGCFNSTGNPGMATGGSGDVLTGILLGLLCQGYSSRDAALLGVFLHGRSADLRVASSSQESLIASEIADYLGEAFASLKWRQTL